MRSGCRWLQQKGTPAISNSRKVNNDRDASNSRKASHNLCASIQICQGHHQLSAERLVAAGKVVKGTVQRDGSSPN
jgi:hypothetical protein